MSLIQKELGKMASDKAGHTGDKSARSIILVLSETFFVFILCSNRG
jgi:hypothetical protein